MKCENCGKNEVTFVYHSNVNGNITEKHLCSACAEQMGYMKTLALHSRSLRRGLWNDSLFGGSLFDDFFAPRLGLADPFVSFFEDMPGLNAVPVQSEEGAAEEKLVEEQEQGRFARMRQLNALRLEMKKAVRKEEFERAAQLRDEIRKLEDARESA